MSGGGARLDVEPEIAKPAEGTAGEVGFVAAVEVSGAEFAVGGARGQAQPAVHAVERLPVEVLGRVGHVGAPCGHSPQCTQSSVCR